MIFVIDDDPVMARCVAKACKACGEETRIFGDAIMAMAALDERLPRMIFLDILLSGPDGFTFLNELISYSDTMKIPVVIISSLDFRGKDLREYGVVGILDKAMMTPGDVKGYVREYARR